MRTLILIFALGFTSVEAGDLSCERWFFAHGLTPGIKDCEVQCAVKGAGMATFMCPSQCLALCKTVIPAFILDRLTYPKGLTKSDKDLIAKYPKDALWVYLAKIDAENATARIFGTNGWNDEADAFRHFMWASLTTEKIGPDKARLFLENHERRPGQSEAERNMDSHNNEQGVSTAVQFQNEKKASQESFEKEALRLIKEGKLKIVSPKGVNPPWRSKY